DERLQRADVTEDRAGTPLTLAITVSSVNGGTCTPLSGVQVDIWHADAQGRYSDEASEGTTGQKFLRGYQVPDPNAPVDFATIYPGWYSGRTAHVHVMVRPLDASGSPTSEFTTQIFFDDALSDAVYATSPYDTRGTRNTRNDNDGIYTSSTQIPVASSG